MNANVLHNLAAVFKIPQNEIKDKISSMVDYGSRYRNLEKKLGLGIVFLLGSKILFARLENKRLQVCQFKALKAKAHKQILKVLSWGKLLPKKDEKFEDVIKHIRKIRLDEEAAKFATLRQVIIQHQLQVFLHLNEMRMQGLY